MEKIGSGSHGTVYKTGSTAIKCVEDEYCFHREVLAGSLLPDSKYLVHLRPICFKRRMGEMSLYKLNLLDYLTKSRYYRQRYTEVGIEERKNIITDIFKGLSVIHSVGFVHSDLSLRNILLRKSKGKLRAAICDFGSTTLANINSEGNTTYYVESPDKVITPAHDFYAVGIIIYSMWKPSILTTSDRKRCLDDAKLIPENYGLQQLAIDLTNNNPDVRLKAASKYISSIHVKLVDIPKSICAESKYIDIINKIITDNSMIMGNLNSRVKESILKTQQHFDSDKYHYVIAAVYLMLVSVDILFDYELLLKVDNGCKKDNRIKHHIRLVDYYIENIIKIPTIIKLFIRYHHDCIC